MRFIADEPSAESIDEVAKAFTASAGDIPATLRGVFATQEFLSGSRGGKLKRPFELIVSALRATRAEVEDEMDLVDYLIRMGHAPFQYPTPDGYPDVASPWTGTLLWRWHFAVALARNDVSKKIVVDEKKLTEEAGGVEGLAASLLGRVATAGELESVERTGEPLAMILASPGFQWR